MRREISGYSAAAPLISYPISYQAMIHAETGRFDLAAERLDEATTLARESGRLYTEAAVVGSRALVDLFRGAWGFKGMLVKFKLEVGIPREGLIKIGQASRAASGADYLVANTLDMVGGESAGAFLLSDGGEEWVRRAELAGRMAALVMARKKGT